VVTTVASGVAHTIGLRVLPGGLTTMQVHVGLALLAVPLGVWHVIVRPAPMRRTDWSRRTALRAGRVLSAAGFVWIAGETAIRLAGLPGRNRRFTGSYEIGTNQPEAMPVTQWLDDRVPQIDPAQWRSEIRTDSAPWWWQPPFPLT
jgi:hypothetical protein